MSTISLKKLTVYRFRSFHCWLNDLEANSGRVLLPQSDPNKRFISIFLKNIGPSIFFRDLQCQTIAFTKASKRAFPSFFVIAKWRFSMIKSSIGIFTGQMSTHLPHKAQAAFR